MPEIGKLDYRLPNVATIVGDKKFFLLQPAERWKMPSWERNIPEHDMIKNTNHHGEIFFSLFIIYLFRYLIEINRQIGFG